MADRSPAAPRAPVPSLLFVVHDRSRRDWRRRGAHAARSATAETAAPRVLAGPADDSLAPLVRKTAPAVVNIAVLQPSPAQQNPLLQDPFFRRYFGVPDAALQPAMAAGSGVIVDGERGLRHHQLPRRPQCAGDRGRLKDGRKLRANLLGAAPELDLAVLKIDAKNLPTLPLGDSRKLQVGDYVVAIGNPFGLGQTVTSGIVSATDRPLGQGDSRRFIQTDAPINPGNSGGALINLARRADRDQLGLVQPQPKRERRGQCRHRLRDSRAMS